MEIIDSLDDKQLTILMITAINSQAGSIQELSAKVDAFLKLSEGKIGRDEYQGEQKRRGDWERATEARVQEIEISRRIAHPEDHERRLSIIEEQKRMSEGNKDFFLGITAKTWRVIASVIAIATFVLAIQD